MDSARLEKKADEERAELRRSIEHVSDGLTPGAMLDRLYFRGAEPGLTGYVKRIQEDPVPAALMAAAMTWSSNREQIKSGLSSVKHSAQQGLSSVKNSAHQGASTGKNKIQQTSDSLKEGAHRMQEKASQGVASMRQSASDSLDSMKESGEHMAHHASEYSHAGYEKGQEMVHEHPWMNMAVGFSLGVSLGGMVPVSQREIEMAKPAGAKLKQVAGRLKEQAHQAKDDAIDSAKEQIEKL